MFGLSGAVPSPLLTGGIGGSGVPNLKRVGAGGGGAPPAAVPSAAATRPNMIECLPPRGLWKMVQVHTSRLCEKISLHLILKILELSEEYRSVYEDVGHVE